MLSSMGSSSYDQRHGTAVQPDRPPTRPGETRFWRSCDPDRLQPFYHASELVRHVMESRSRETAHGAVPVAGRHQ